MHNFVYLAQRRSQQEFSREPNFGGGCAPAPLAAPVYTIQCYNCYLQSNSEICCTL